MGLTCSKSSSCTSIIAIDGRKHGATENNRSDSLDPFMYDVMRKSLSMTLLENANQAAATTTSTTTSQEAASFTTIDNHNVNHSDMNSKNQGKFNYMDSGAFPSPYVGQHHLLYKNQKLENIVQIQSQSLTNASEITGAQTESKPQTQTQSDLLPNVASTKTATGVNADTLTGTTDANTTGTTNTNENSNAAASYRPPTTTAISESTVTIGDIKSSVSPPWTAPGIGMQQNKQHNRMQMQEDPYHHRMYNSTSPTAGQVPSGSAVCPTTPSAGTATSCSSSSAKTTLIPDAEWSYKYPTKLVVRRRSINYHHQQQHHDTDCNSNPAVTGTSNCSSTSGTHIYAVRYPAQVFDSDENDLDGISINHPALVSQEQCPTSLMSKSKKQYHKQRQQHQQSAAAGPASCTATATTATGHHTKAVSSTTATTANTDSKKLEITDHHHYQQQQQQQPSSLPSPLSEPQDYFQPSYMLKNRPQQLINDWVTVSEEHNIYIVDVGLTPLQCDRIVQVTELACRGQYAAYTYAKQTLGCREFPFLAQVCAPPIHSMVHSILAFSDQRNNEKNNSKKNSSSTNKNNNSRESQQQQQQLYGQQPSSTSSSSSKNNNNGSNNNSSNNSNGTTATSYNLQLDDREPHLVKYDVTKKERQKLDMHTDKSEWTFLIALSNGCGLDYDGGGTYFECLNATIHVSRGHALVFPGKLRHCGQRITRGLRYLLVGFLVNKQNTQSAVTAAAASAQQTNSSSNTNASSSSISTNNKNNDNNNVKSSCSSPTSCSNDNQDSSSGAVDDHVYHQRTF